VQDPLVVVALQRDADPLGDDEGDDRADEDAMRRNHVMS
jgi:hypothetical protein